MTRDTSRRQPLELSDSRTLVAVVTLYSGVGSQQGKPILVILHLLHGDIPALHRVAIRAIRAHLVLVHVGVAVPAILGYIGENRFHVALRALHFLVHAAQRIFSFAVVKLRNCFDGPPGCRGMAVLTRNCKRSVRTTAVLPLRRRSGPVGVSWLPSEEQHPAQNLNKSARNCPLYNHLPTIRLRRPGRSKPRADT